MQGAVKDYAVASAFSKGGKGAPKGWVVLEDVADFECIGKFRGRRIGY